MKALTTEKKSKNSLTILHNFESADRIVKPIHLLYVPTIFCNMGCQYCYLGDLTDQKVDTKTTIGTLKTALAEFVKEGYLPYTVSLHGGEVTALAPRVLDQLLDVIGEFTHTHAKKIRQQGYVVNPSHIKTNMLNFDRHYEVLDRHKVSISGSIDLPLSMHAKYRVDKKNQSTLPKILENLKLLATYPHRKKISCVVTKAHLTHIDEFINDIWYLHRDIGLDMGRFNVMFSFDSDKNKEKYEKPIDGLEMLTQTEQVEFYYKISDAFKDSELKDALKTEWFKEFTPEYCCSAVNCGEKFFLLQYDGEIYSCPRGQSSEKYRYGNLLTEGVNAVIQNAWQTIEHHENRLDVHDDCKQCEYVKYCNVGCTFVRDESGLNKSYTCKLQKILYKNESDKYPPMQKEEIKEHVHRLLLSNNIKSLKKVEEKKQSNLTPEITESRNQLMEIVKADTILEKLYLETLFKLDIDGVLYDLSSPLLNNCAPIEVLSPDSKIVLHIHEDIFSYNCREEVNNTLDLMMLRNTQVVYGDEGRTKQEHLFNYSIYKDRVLTTDDKAEKYQLFDISKVIQLHSEYYLEDVRNNLMFSTKKLRDYHYDKHKKNAFYHIQAINLPFPNIEFYWSQQ